MILLTDQVPITSSRAVLRLANLFFAKRVAVDQRRRVLLDKYYLTLHSNTRLFSFGWR
jgi:hypothetical protein